MVALLHLCVARRVKPRSRCFLLQPPSAGQEKLGKLACRGNLLGAAVASLFPVPE